MSIDLDAASTGRGKWFSFPDVGSTFKGRFLSADERQATDYVSGTPKTWDDGTPVLEYVMEFQTDLNEGDGDDGRRTIYAGKASRLFKAMSEAVKAAGLRWADGPLLTVKRIEDGDPVTLKNGKKGNAPKQFKAKAEAAKPTADLDDDFA